MALYVDKKYTSKKDTPLAWHTFTRYIRCPLGVLYILGTLISLNNEAQTSELLICIDVLYLISVGLEVVFFIGSFNWTKYAFKAKIISLFYSIFVNFCIVSISYQSAGSSFGTVLGSCIAAYLEYVYYKKREMLFNDSKNDDVYENTITHENIITQSNNEEMEDTVENNDESNVSKNSKTLYCRKCGTKLDESSIYCRKCGTKVER